MSSSPPSTKKTRVDGEAAEEGRQGGCQEVGGAGEAAEEGRQGGCQEVGGAGEAAEEGRQGGCQEDRGAGEAAEEGRQGGCQEVGGAGEAAEEGRQGGCQEDRGAGEAAEEGRQGGCQEDRGARTDWRLKCVDEFGLLDLPSNWSSARFSKLSASTIETWERYYKYRIKHEPSKSGEDDSDGEKDDDYDDGSKFLLREIKGALASEVDKVGGDLAQSWLKHTVQSVVDVCLEDADDVRSATYRAVVFSPYAIPHAVELRHRYHHRSRYCSVEFYCTWEFKLVRFDGETGGDIVQEKLESGMLCSNEFMDPPSDEVDWCPVESIDVSNFTPTTCRRIREWIFGPRHKSLACLDDFSFLRLIFASCGTANFDTNRGNIGYCWSSSDSAFAEEIEAAVKELRETMDVESGNHGRRRRRGRHGRRRRRGSITWRLNWLEHQARLISGNLRLPDMYYEPYDILEAKGEWGTQVLDRREEEREESTDGKSDDDDDEEEYLRKVPWLVWDRAEQNRGNFSLMMQMMGVGM